MKPETRVTAVCLNQGARLLFLLALFLVAAGPPYALAQMHARVVHRNLAELAAQASVIVRGQVLEARLEPHPDFPNSSTVVVTLRVQEELKGSVGGTFTFRQYLYDPRERAGRLGYRVGESIVVMMHSSSPLGFSSPVGLEQGRFRVTTDSSGNVMVTNGWDNAGLLKNVRTTSPKLESRVSPPVRRLLDQHQSGPIPYDQFREMVRGLVAE